MKVSVGDLKSLRRISEGYFRTIPAAPNKPDPRDWRDDQLTLSWLGHATVLINFLGVWILTDPALRARVGLRVGPLTLGPKRYVAPALRASELPPLDFILLTHAHMDHLDVGTLRRLRRDVTVVTAAATRDLLTPMRFRDVIEMGWGESRQFDTSGGGLSIEAFRVQHWGARMRHDVHRGFNGYVLERQGRRICLAGDTAQTSFTAVGRKPTDVMVVPIGAYNPWIASHCTPEQAVEMANQPSRMSARPSCCQALRLSTDRADVHSRQHSPGDKAWAVSVMSADRRPALRPRRVAQPSNSPPTPGIAAQAAELSRNRRVSTVVATHATPNQAARKPRRFRAREAE
jgi:L-ascorbate metabolism protein UlaG (beta-lactamase superfamily)